MALIEVRWGDVGWGGVERVRLPYMKKRRIKPGLPVQSQTLWAAIGTGIRPRSMAL